MTNARALNLYRLLCLLLLLACLVQWAWPDIALWMGVAT